MKKCVGFILFFIVACLMLAGCAKESTAPDKKKTEKPPISNKKPTEKKTIYRYPLTGLPSEKESSQRVVAVMVNNHHLARPQSGLDQADIVYEALAEGNITRFLALFQSHKPEMIGPVRSARPYFIKLSQGYHSLYVCHGWSPTAKKMLTRGDADSLNGLFYDGTLFHRASFRKAPHNSYISFQNIEKGAKEKNYDMTDDIAPLPFVSGKGNDVQSQPVKSITVHYASNNIPGYKYDAAKHYFVRTINGKTAKDRESGKPLTAKNVMVLAANHHFIDDYGRRSIDIASGGNGYLLQNGELTTIQWKNKNGRLLPFKDGQPLSFIPGKTWINLVPDKKNLDQYVKISKE